LTLGQRKAIEASMIEVSIGSSFDSRQKKAIPKILKQSVDRNVRKRCSP
jgi:hypothetical protein